MGNASCCENEPAEEPKEVVEAQHASFEPKLDVEPKLDIEPKLDVEKCKPEVTLKPRASKVLTMPQFEVDADIIRGIDLRDSLRELGKLWRRSPLDLKLEDRAGLWEKSRPVEGYDVFLSHTWRTHGHWKVLALLLQSGWKQIWAVWFSCVALMMVAATFRLLPMPLRWVAGTLGFVTPTPFGPWMLITSFLSIILASSWYPIYHVGSPRYASWMWFASIKPTTNSWLVGFMAWVASCASLLSYECFGVLLISHASGATRQGAKTHAADKKASL